jgi:hypothetical protein
MHAPVDRRGSDAGIEAGLTARAADPALEITLLIADRYPNCSICGIPSPHTTRRPPVQQLDPAVHATSPPTIHRLSSIDDE